MNLRLLLAYDGTAFRGLAPNVGVRTVVGELQRVLEPLVGPVPDIVMAGRTDAGVHAWGQVLSVVVPDRGPRGPIDPERLQRSINARLGPEVVARSVEVVDDSFNARFSAIGRRYRYLILNRPYPDPFLARTSWWVANPLDVAAMEEATSHLIGQHDFSSFCRRPRPRPIDPDDGRGAVEVQEPSLIRRVTGARWRALDPEPGDEADLDGVLRFEIEGSAFCHQMVRSIVGFLAAVGSGRRRADEVPAVLAARDRSVAESPAPANGLTLWRVDYPDDGGSGPGPAPPIADPPTLEPGSNRP